MVESGMQETYSAGRALGLGLKVLLRNLIPFTILSLVIAAPYFAYAYLALDDMHFDLDGGFVGDDALGIKLTVIGMLVGLLTSSTLTYGVVMELKGQRASMAACVVTGLRRFFPVLGVGILIGLIVGIPAVLVGVVVWMARLELFGVLLLAVVVALVYAIYYVAIPASVIERPGVSGALLRSRELTAGRRRQVVSTILLVMVVHYGVHYVIADSMIDVRELVGGGQDAVLHLVKKLTWVDVGLTTLFSMVGGCVAACTYYLLRSEKEGVSADDLASVFD